MLTFNPIADDNRTVLYSDTISTDLRYAVNAIHRHTRAKPRGTKNYAFEMHGVADIRWASTPLTVRGAYLYDKDPLTGDGPGFFLVKPMSQIDSTSFSADEQIKDWFSWLPEIQPNELLVLPRFKIDQVIAMGIVWHDARLSGTEVYMHIGTMGSVGFRLHLPDDVDKITLRELKKPVRATPRDVAAAQKELRGYIRKYEAEIIRLVRENVDELT